MTIFFRKASTAVDGFTLEDLEFYHSEEHDPFPWFMVDLGHNYPIGHIKFYIRVDTPGTYRRAANLTVSVIE